jgi:NAD(P)-dependent dehydrogenase (short-subunit alcohol dehydrogenase family)
VSSARGIVAESRSRGRPDARKERKEMTNQEKYMGKLEGKIALITGGNGGIGLETAKQFVNQGAYVFITGGREPQLVAAVKEIGKNVIGVQGKVSNLGDLDRLFAQIKRQKRRLDIVFVKAGVEKHSPLGRITNDGYRSDFDINVKDLFFSVQKALPLLPDGASIILNAFVVATHRKGANGAENATRAAVRSFGRMWTTDLKERRIRVNAVNPGPVDTPRLKDLLPSREAGGHPLELTSNRASLRRFGTPEEIAEAAVFLASDDSRHITGTELFVGAGFAQL